MIPLEDPDPEGLLTVVMDVLDLEDTTGYYVLIQPTKILDLNSGDISALQTMETACVAKSKLSDSELSALGLTR